jgi:uncharacterized protein
MEKSGLMLAMEPSAPLTGSDFYRFFQCPHWPYWERFGDKADRRPLTKEEEARLADGLAHERDIVTSQFGTPDDVSSFSNIDEGVARTLELMRAGVPVIYQGWLRDGDWIGRPDLLERQPGKSLLGDWFYVPVDVKRAHELKKEHMCQLSFYATLVERVQGHFPTHPAIINGDGERLAFDAASFQSEFATIVEQLERIRAGEMPAPVYRKSCNDTSPWGKACLRLAESRRDIALLFNVDVKKLRALRSLGVLTIDDAATFELESLEGRVPGLTRHALETIQRQAQSLVSGSVLIRKPFLDQTVGTEIHFDIESYPPVDRDYLFGFWIKGEYKAFVADKPEEEEKMWKEFLAWTATLPERYTVYHYANHEVSRLSVLARRYGDEEDLYLERFQNSMCDLKEVVREHVVFPLHFYSLKAIAKFLGFSWDGDVKGGGESVLAYERWLESSDRSILDAIIQYNREDVQATSHVLAWLRAHAKDLVRFAPPFPWK